MSLSVIIDGVTHHVNQVTITANNSVPPPGISTPPMSLNPNISPVIPVTDQEQLQQEHPPLSLQQPAGQISNPQSMLAVAGQNAMGNMMHLNPQSMLAAAGQNAMGNMQNPLAQSAFGAAKSLFSNGAAAPPAASGSGYVNPYANITKNNPVILQPFNPVKHTGGSKKRRNKRSNNTRKYRRIRKRSTKH